MSYAGSDAYQAVGDRIQLELRTVICVGFLYLLVCCRHKQERKLLVCHYLTLSHSCTYEPAPPYTDDGTDLAYTPHPQGDSRSIDRARLPYHALTRTNTCPNHHRRVTFTHNVPHGHCSSGAPSVLPARTDRTTRAYLHPLLHFPGSRQTPHSMCGIPTKADMNTRTPHVAGLRNAVQ